MPVGGVVPLQIAQFDNEVGGKMQGIDEGRGKRRMTALAKARGAQGGLALVAHRDLHLGGFANETGARLADQRGNTVQHFLNADTADFLVVGQDKFQGLAQVGLGRAFRGRQHGGDIAFHVGGATTIEAILFAGEAEGIAGPVLTVDGHHIGVGGQHDAVSGGAEFRIEACFLAIGAWDAGDGKPAVFQEIFGIGSQFQIGIAADGVEADETVENFESA